MRDVGRSQHRGVNSPTCSSLGKLVLPGWCNPLSSHTTLFPPTCSHHEAPLGQLHMSVNRKIAIRNFLNKSWWRNGCRYIELLWSKLPVYVRVCGFYITELWQRTHLGGHTRADRMDRQQKLASQAVPLRYLADPDPDSAVALLSRRWIQFKMGFLSPLYWERGARKGHLLSQGTRSGKSGSVLSCGSSPLGPCTILS